MIIQFLIIISQIIKKNNERKFDHMVNSINHDNIYDIMNGKINETKLKYDYIAKCIIEGCIFVNPSHLTGNIGQINGQTAMLCSVKKNEGYNDVQKISVHVKNKSLNNKKH